MRRKIIRIAGIVVLLAALIANLQYAFNNYGIVDISLSERVLGQTNSATPQPLK